MWFCRCFSLYWTAVASKVKKKKVGHWKERKREGEPETHSLFRMIEVPGAARMALTMSWEGASHVVGGLLPWVVLFTMSFPLFTDQLSERPCGRSSSLSATATSSAPPNPQATVPSTTPAQQSQAKAVVSEVPTPCPLCLKICHIRSASQMHFHTWWGRYSVWCVTRQTTYRVKASSNWNARLKQVGGAPASGTQGWSPALLFMRIQLVTLLGMLCKCLLSWPLLMALRCSFPYPMTLLEYVITWDLQAINIYLLLFWSWLLSFFLWILNEQDPSITGTNLHSQHSGSWGRSITTSLKLTWPT